MENNLFTKCPTRPGFERACTHSDLVQTLTRDYCVCNVQNLINSGKESVTTPGPGIASPNLNIDLFSLMKPQNELNNTEITYTKPALTADKPRMSSPPALGLQNFMNTDNRQEYTIINNLGGVGDKSHQRPDSIPSLNMLAAALPSCDILTPRASVRVSKSEEIKNEQSSMVESERQARKAMIKEVHNIDLKTDEEWTYTPPKYYNVKETSMAALNSYKYVTLYKHNKRTNRTIRYFVCQYHNCDRKFNKSWNFIDHMRMHNGEKPYTCNHCGRQFTQKGNFNKHCRIHSTSDS